MLKGPLYISIYLKSYFNNYLEKILFMFSTKTQQLLYLERKKLALLNLNEINFPILLFNLLKIIGNITLKYFSNFT